MGKHAPVKVRLIRKLSNYGQPDKCWEWQGYKRANTGYGKMAISGKTEYTHRVAYVELGGGKLDPNLEIRHLCNNGSCCNPAHLKQGTRSENVLDQVKAGTHYSHFRANPAAKGSKRKIDHEAVVSEFIRKYEFIKRPQGGGNWRSNAKELAKKYNTKETYITKIVRNTLRS